MIRANKKKSVELGGPWCKETALLAFISLVFVCVSIYRLDGLGHNSSVCQDTLLWQQHTPVDRPIRPAAAAGGTKNPEEKKENQGNQFRSLPWGG